MKDIDYMQLALQEAKKGCGHVNPNPMVGALIVKEDCIIGRGYHKRFGDAHAERVALADCKRDPAGGTLYVTLEPCCHYGKTPPCTEAIIAARITRVVIGSMDPNPKVAGGGAAQLEKAGITVEKGVLKGECDALNTPFFHYITTGRPWVLLKAAMTADGKIATHTGASRYVSSDASRRECMALRSRLAGIMVGVGTVLADDPALTCRLPSGKNPLRIICDTHLRTPLSAQVVTTARTIPTLIATASQDEERIAAYRELGCEVALVAAEAEGVHLPSLMDYLGARGIDSVLLEGGAALNDSALRSGIVSRVRLYLAPKIFGGALSKTPVGGRGVATPGEAISLVNRSLRIVDEDIVIEWEVEKACSQEL